jgi:hypothetical protein
MAVLLGRTPAAASPAAIPEAGLVPGFAPLASRLDSLQDQLVLRAELNHPRRCQPTSRDGQRSVLLGQPTRAFRVRDPYTAAS